MCKVIRIAQRDFTGERKLPRRDQAFLYHQREPRLIVWATWKSRVRRVLSLSLPFLSAIATCRSSWPARGETAVPGSESCRWVSPRPAVQSPMRLFCTLHWTWEFSSRPSDEFSRPGPAAQLILRPTGSPLFLLRFHSTSSRRSDELPRPGPSGSWAPGPPRVVPLLLRSHSISPRPSDESSRPGPAAEAFGPPESLLFSLSAFTPLRSDANSRNTRVTVPLADELSLSLSLGRVSSLDFRRVWPRKRGARGSYRDRLSRSTLSPLHGLRWVFRRSGMYITKRFIDTHTRRAAANFIGKPSTPRASGRPRGQEGLTRFNRVQILRAEFFPEAVE